ncbi:hypothetical protein BDQ12DRAFT_690930 [Crucibulum laeve]|uniref:Uncharacterized protein n=1 Tax=Crucibulum laeve TaxID=68775 RepID=A0A5C3LMU5_9AGAR|nr:hypothetical protein BDQ12DRAFT_690930 [Crucibulum laeve]
MRRRGGSTSKKGSKLVRKPPSKLRTLERLYTNDSATRPIWTGWVCFTCCSDLAEGLLQFLRSGYLAIIVTLLMALTTP